MQPCQCKKVGCVVVGEPGRRHRHVQVRGAVSLRLPVRRLELLELRRVAQLHRVPEYLIFIANKSKLRQNDDDKEPQIRKVALFEIAEEGRAEVRAQQGLDLLPNAPAVEQELAQPARPEAQAAVEQGCASRLFQAELRERWTGEGQEVWQPEGREAEEARGVHEQVQAAQRNRFGYL